MKVETKVKLLTLGDRVNRALEKYLNQNWTANKWWVPTSRWQSPKMSYCMAWLSSWWKRFSLYPYICFLILLPCTIVKSLASSPQKLPCYKAGKSQHFTAWPRHLDRDVQWEPGCPSQTTSAPAGRRKSKGTFVTHLRALPRTCHFLWNKPQFLELFC